MRTTTIAVIAFDQISPFHLSVPCVVFGEALPQVPAYEIKVCAVRPGLLMTSIGFDIAINMGLEGIEEAEIVIVPSWSDPLECPPRPLLDALVSAYQRGAMIVGLCLGAFVLAEAGLLDGLRATTHWGYAQDLTRRFPLIKVDANVLYVDEGRVITSAGTAAALDCCLHILRQRNGAETANKAARRLVVAPHRQGGQAQFIERPIPATIEDARFAELLNWIRANLHTEHSLDSLARRVAMSRRTFTRHFRQLTGTTFTDWLLGERLAMAQQLLESTSQPVEWVAEKAGFRNSASLRSHFGATFGVSPSAWRQSFREDSLGSSA
jgi:transcriptional regulator GlxA family with amidase domain